MEKEHVMICNVCGKIFNIHDAAVVERKMYGINIQEKRCPDCKGMFRALEIPHDLDKYLYVDNDDKYYSYIKT